MEIDHVQEQDPGNKGYIFPGTHFHVGAEPINMNSLGCQTTLRANITDKIDPLMKKVVKKWGSVVTPTWIESKHIV